MLTDNSNVTCDGVTVTSAMGGLLPRKWYTGLYVLVPQGQMCLFVPQNNTKLALRVYRWSQEFQPVILKCKEECRVKENSVLGKIYFLTRAAAPKLVWGE